MRKKGRCLIIVSILLLIISGVGLEAEQTTPYLLGLNPDSARASLASQLGYSDADSVNLVVLPDSFYTDSLVQGVIYKQYPEPDSVLEDTVKVRLTAPLTIDFPDLRGMQVGDAAEYITGLGFELQPFITRNSDEYPLNTVMKTNPEPGERIQRGRTVALIISKGELVRNPVLTSTGVPINLYEETYFQINGISVESPDSSGFTLAFKVKISSPYRHSIKAEDFKIEVRLQGGIVQRHKPEVTPVKLGPKGATTRVFKIPFTYSEIHPSIAEVMLSDAVFRLTGTYSLIVESGFTRKPIKTGDFEFNVGEASAEVTEKLTAIAFLPEDESGDESEEVEEESVKESG
ncbi:PASTA domain-containing protein [candidate division WOR-3 bacterium]|uniref:PASTA domain-containing protein n=1 Tax=candidate division WOR-3 bacterium TaxID=2052148 RepID=A0A9D5KA72_UNCW3|nr:PASTA domain-containing protein [candidate division WOR-3 bacterium]MBD3364474.1 PASTA domain-containing protein [candidate division WOR-3 bacterium]